MTIKEVQQLIEAWESKSPAQNGTVNASPAIMAEKAAQTARAAATANNSNAVAKELAEAMWSLFSLANHRGVDLTEAIIDYLESKNNAL